jgi:hypothetical protein
MMTGLSIVLGTSLLLFVGSLAYAVVQDWIGTRRTYQKIIAEHAAQSGHYPMQRNFRRAAQRPARILGSFIL